MRERRTFQYKHSNTPLNEMFFSQENMDRIQQMLHDAAFQMVGADIGKQSVPDLMLVMRSYYLTYATNIPGSDKWLNLKS
jgi:hypothetical protein